MGIIMKFIDTHTHTHIYISCISFIFLLVMVVYFSEWDRIDLDSCGKYAKLFLCFIFLLCRLQIFVMMKMMVVSGADG